MASKKSPQSKKKRTNLTHKLFLLIFEVLLPFGLYRSLVEDNNLLSIITAGFIFLGMLLLVVFR